MFALLLAAVGQPIFTDDLWWHLALGRAQALTGLGLPDDPLLYTGAGPPSSAAWLSEVLLFNVLDGLGFSGLRVFHVLLVVAILALGVSLFRRAGGSALAASLFAMAFAALSAYRFVQLRPHLFSILAALVLYRLLLEGGRIPSRTRVVIAALLVGFWANVHSGFLLGPVLIAAAALGLVLALPLRAAEVRVTDRQRALRLAVAAAACAAATLVNPSGVAPHLAYFAAGSETPSLLRVADEWLPIDLFALPASGLPPSPLAWALVWLLVLAVPLLAISAARRWRAGHSDLDPALVALAAVSLPAMLGAVRFTWMGVFALLLVASASQRMLARRETTARTWGLAMVSVVLAVAFFRLGDWPMISGGLRAEWARYKQPYAVGKYYAHGAWVLRDARVSGNLYNDYFMGGFLGYWLAPDVKGFVNGSLNVPPRVMQANRAIRQYRGLSSEETLLELLDAEQVDLFFGIRLPTVPETARPVFYTTTYLERAKEWIPIFRNVGSAVYLRRNERNRENLERLSVYYAGHGVPFDPDEGFDAERAIREALPWSIRNGLVPRDFVALAAATQAVNPAERVRHRDRLASVYAALGLYDAAVRLDRRTLAFEPGQEATRRRLVWSLLHLDRAGEAVEAAEPLAAPGAHRLSRELAAAARDYAALDDAREAAAFAARLPLWAQVEARWMATGLLPPEARLR